MTDLTINLVAPIQGYTGYAVQARNLALALEDKGVDITWFPIYGVRQRRQPSEELREVMPLVQKREEREWSLDNPTIRLTIGSSNDIIQLGGNGKKIIYTVWECSKLPKGWIHSMNQVDEVWTASEWGKEMFIDSGVTETEVKVVPEGVNPDVFYSTVDDLIGEQVPDDGTFKFLHVGKYEKRKGQRVLARAFAEEFDKDEPVSLYFNQENQFQDVDVYTQLFAMNLPEHPKIQPYNINLDSKDMRKFYSSFDAFVNASRGEGFGLPVLEAMACELPVVTTNITGMAEYVTEDNAFTVRTKGLEQVDVPLPGVEIELGMKWYKPDKKHLGKQMRYVYEHDKEPLKKAEEGRKTAEEYTWGKSAERVIELLEE